MKKEGNYISSRIKSFRDAFHGLWYIINTQANFRIQAIIGFIAIILGSLLNISGIEWCIIVLAIGSVMGAEAVNTSIELLCDKVEEAYSETIRRIKDTAAFGVLIVSISAFAIGCIIFLPKIIDRINLP